MRRRSWTHGGPHPAARRAVRRYTAAITSAQSLPDVTVEDVLGTSQHMMRPTTLAAAIALGATLAVTAAIAQDAAPAVAQPAPTTTPASQAAAQAGPVPGTVENPASPAAEPEPLATPEAAAATIPPAPLPTGDAGRGKPLTYTCIGCHGVTGYRNAYPSYHVPRIGGQTAEYLRNALSEYKHGTRRHPTMQAQAQSFSDQDLADIAAYLSSIK